MCISMSVCVSQDMSGSVRAAIDAHVVREPEFREDVAVLLKGIRSFDIGGDGNLMYVDDADAVHVVVTPRNLVQIFTATSTTSTSPTRKTLAGADAVTKRRRKLLPHEMVKEGRKRQRHFAARTNGGDDNTSMERQRRREEEEREQEEDQRTRNRNGRENELPLRITAGPAPQGPPTASVSPPGMTDCGPLCVQDTNRDTNATKLTDSTQNKTHRHDDDAELEALLRGLENEGGGGSENFGV